MRAFGVAAAVSVMFALVPAATPAGPSAPMPRAEGWLVKAMSELEVPAPPASLEAELERIKAMEAKRTSVDVDRMRWWSVGGPGYRWSEIAVEELIENFVVLPMAARHLALLHAAMDDAVASAWHNKRRFQVPRPSAASPAIEPALPVPSSPSYPSDHAAAAAAAAEILGHIFPSRAAALQARAEEAMSDRVLAGIEYPSDVAAGRALGKRVAALALARGKLDRSDAKWNGTMPQGPGVWKGTNPIMPAAATWQPWVLARPDEMRPAPPPAIDSDQVKSAIAELRRFERTPRTNHRALYWETFGGARAHALWNDIARMKLLEHEHLFDAPAAARAMAALNIAFLDAAIACWDAKYAYWYIRPSQLDPDLKPVFAPPNHPSYPAAHGCLSTAAATVLAAIFPRDRERLLAQGREAAEARIWAGIHYRFDIDAGQALGRRVAEKVLLRAFANVQP
jgi:membrane-associated phospholipid phosphatase